MLIHLVMCCLRLRQERMETMDLDMYQESASDRTPPGHRLLQFDCSTTKRLSIPRNGCAGYNLVEIACLPRTYRSLVVPPCLWSNRAFQRSVYGAWVYLRFYGTPVFRVRATRALSRCVSTERLIPPRVAMAEDGTRCTTMGVNEKTLSVKLQGAVPSTGRC